MYILALSANALGRHIGFVSATSHSLVSGVTVGPHASLVLSWPTRLIPISAAAVKKGVLSVEKTSCSLSMLSPSLGAQQCAAYLPSFTIIPGRTEVRVALC